jgi:hypothetical protein
VYAAVLASVALHATLVGLLAWLPCAGERVADPQEHARQVVYLGGADVAAPGGLRTKLLSGDGAGGGASAAPMPGGPAAIVVPDGPPAAGAALGPPLIGIGSSPGAPGGGPGDGPGGGPATTFFGLPAHGLSVAYVLDRSASMGLRGALATARDELLTSLRRLPAAARFQVIVYNGTAEALVPPVGALVAATPANVAQAAAALADYGPGGTTRHQQGLVAGLRLRPDVLFFLTDGDDLTDDDLAAAARANLAHTVIHTVELSTEHRGQPAMPMQRLARSSGGSYRAVALAP